MQIAVFGAGYAGLSLARRLEQNLPPEVSLVVVDEDDHHLVQHEIHRAIRRPAVADALRVPLADVFERAEIREARVTDLDTEAGVATLDGDESLHYDVGAVCLGAETAFYDLPGVEEHATPLKRLDDAAEIREGFFDVIEDGEAEIVIGGAGLSGIQVTGELAALAREESISEQVTLRLLEQQSAVAPNFPERFQRAVHEALSERDVRVETNAAVAAADSDTITLESGRELAYDQFVWTGGICGPDALAGERPLVRGRLRYEDDTFLVGDVARIVDTDGQATPASAQSAVRSATVAADNVERLVDDKRGDGGGFEPRLATFQFDSPGWLVSIGDGAVAQVGSAVVTGRAAVALKTTVGAGYLTSVGSVQQAVDLAREELTRGEGSGDDAPDPADVVDESVAIDTDDDGS